MQIRRQTAKAIGLASALLALSITIASAENGRSQSGTTTELTTNNLTTQYDWPIFIAPEGCRFEWDGPNNYRETARSYGPAEFPDVNFWRDDEPSFIQKFIPFCGADCLKPEFMAGLYKFLPLEAGKTVETKGDYGDVTMLLRFTDLGIESMPRLNNMKAHRVKTETEVYIKDTEELLSEMSDESWWATEIGWIVKYKTDDFEKSVYEFSCP